MNNNIIKNIAFVVLTFVSAVFSVSLFIKFSRTLDGQILMALLALGFESLKILCFVWFKAYFKVKHYIFILFLSVYVILAGVSAVATAGFAISNIKAKTSVFNVDYTQKKIYQDKLAEIENQKKLYSTSKSYKYKQLESDISSYQNELSILENSLVYSNTNDIPIIKKRIKDTKYKKSIAMKEMENLSFDNTSANMQELNKQEAIYQSNLILVESRTTDDIENVFTLLGDIFGGMSAEKFMTLLLLIFTITLEVGIAITSGNVKTKDEKLQELISNESDKSLFITYIDGLFDGVTTRLRSNEYISEKFGITIKKCIEIKSFLTSYQHDNKFLLQVKKGGTYSPFSKEKILSILENQLKHT